jgi:hypothetical protein
MSEFSYVHHEFFCLWIIGESLMRFGDGRTGDGGLSSADVHILLFPAFVLSMVADRQTAKLPVCLPTVPGLMRGACAVVVETV